MILTALVFFAILSILVLIHELGHYAVARWIGVHVEEFGLGLPPRIFGRKIGGTIYSLNWLPIGGFVKLAGEDEDSHVSRITYHVSRKYFWARSKKERAAILVAGVTMNILLALGLTAYLLTQGVLEPSGQVRVEKVQPGSPAETAGLKAEDIIVSAYEYPKLTLEEPLKLKTLQQLITFTREHLGKPLGLTIRRGEEILGLVATPRASPPAGQGPLGVVITDLELRTYTWQEIPIEAIRINIVRAKDMFIGIGGTIWRLATLKPPAADVAGPIGIARVTGQAVKFGWKAVLEFMSILSLNLAVLNILPIPALDGGRLAFVFAEKLIGRKLRPAFERSAHQVGMIILLGLILLVSVSDILRLTRGL